MDIITTYHLLNVLEYKIKAYTRHKLQHEYNNSSVHSNHHPEEHDPTTDEIKQKRRTTSTLLIPGSRTRNLSLDEEEEEEEGELQNKQASLSRHDHRITCTYNYCCNNL